MYTVFTHTCILYLHIHKYMYASCITCINYADSAVIRKHGKDYEAMSNALEGKTVPQCKNFFTNYKRKLNLPKLIAEYEIRHVSIYGSGSVHVHVCEIIVFCLSNLGARDCSDFY